MKNTNSKEKFFLVDRPVLRICLVFATFTVGLILMERNKIPLWGYWIIASAAIAYNLAANFLIYKRERKRWKRMDDYYRNYFADKNKNV